MFSASIWAAESVTSSMVTLQNITNGFCKLEYNGRVFLTDPWVTDGIFEGGWATYPPIQDAPAALRQCDYLYISHIHEDHSDLKAIEQLPRTALVVIPDLFPNHLIRDALTKLGFNHIKMLKPLTVFEPAPDLSVEVIPPLNSFAQEQEFYQKGHVPVSIDTGLLINWDGLRLLMLNDNSPYDLEPLSHAKTRLTDCDLLATNYNGGADDYPICYRGFSDPQKRELCDERDAKKLRANLHLIKQLRPKAVLPYSSEFSICGPRAVPFATIRQGVFSDKLLMAERLQKESGIPAFALYEDDRLQLDAKGARKIRDNKTYPSLLDRAQLLHAEKPNYAGRFPEIDDLNALWRDAREAAEHMFHYMDKYGWTSEWVFQVQLVEQIQPWSVDLGERNVIEGPVSDHRKRLCCFTDACYFGALIHRLSHWNNAIISYNLEWERIPNEYDPLLYKAINFFHVPRPVFTRV
jgi:UDP-MurNAc hydroxylase